MTSPFGSINQHQVVEVLVHAAYAGAAAVCAHLIIAVGNLHLTGLGDILLTGSLVPTLKFLVAFFSGQAAMPNGTTIDTAPPQQ